MKIQDFRKMNEKELASLIIEKRTELQKMRAQVVSGQLKHNHLFKVLRNDIARIQTVLKELKKHA